MSISVVKCSWVKCGEVLQFCDDLSNKVSNIIRRHTDNMKLLPVCVLLLSHSVIFFRFYFLSLYMWLYSCLKTVIYISLLLCLCILIAFLCISIVPAGTLRLP